MTPRAVPRRARRAVTAGFTLFEVLLAVLILGTALVASTWSMTATARTKAAYDQAASPALFLAQEIFTLADGLPRTPIGMTGATTGAAVVALDSLVGAKFSPPILADASVAPGFEGWEQSVDLSVYALDDLATPTGDDPAEGLAPESGCVYRLDIEVRHDGEAVGSFSWWVHP
jgi:prepilin-type N-terminal cleavage/methylation domain-containing protein